MKKQVIEGSVKPEISKLDQYLEILKKSQRFKNVRGPLYDPVAGWNPGYRVFQRDLMSPIPLVPFEAIHTKIDIPFGQPSDSPEEDSIGYMPFQWFQGSARISAHPINFEIARAKAIRKLYEWVVG